MTGNTIHVGNWEGSSLLRDTWCYQVLRGADMLLPIADTSWLHLGSPTACMPRCPQRSKVSFSSKHNNPLQNNTKFNSKTRCFRPQIFNYYIFIIDFKLFIICCYIPSSRANTSERLERLYVWCLGHVSSSAECLTTKYRCLFHLKLWQYSNV